MNRRWGASDLQLAIWNQETGRTAAWNKVTGELTAQNQETGEPAAYNKKKEEPVTKTPFETAGGTQSSWSSWCCWWKGEPAMQEKPGDEVLSGELGDTRSEALSRKT